MTPDSTLAVTNTCPKDGVHLSWKPPKNEGPNETYRAGYRRAKVSWSGVPWTLTSHTGRDFSLRDLDVPPYFE